MIVRLVAVESPYRYLSLPHQSFDPLDPRPVVISSRLFGEGKRAAGASSLDGDPGPREAHSDRLTVWPSPSRQSPVATGSRRESLICGGRDHPDGLSRLAVDF